MKNLSIALIASSILISSYTFAHSNSEKVVLKSRKLVENTAPDDWKSLAEAAAFCINEKTNLLQASEWLDKSLSIKVTALNLEIKGDYMLLSNQPDKAMSYYIKAIQAGLNNDIAFDVKQLQTKIQQLKESKNL